MEHAEGKRKFNIEKFDESLYWFRWISESPTHGLSDETASEAIKDVAKKVNEIIDALNKQ